MNDQPVQYAVLFQRLADFHKMLGDQTQRRKNSKAALLESRSACEEKDRIQRRKNFEAVSPELRSACVAKDIRLVRELLSKIPVGATDVTTCLSIAWPNVEVMRVLLEHGADPSICATTRYMKKSIVIVKLLVEFGYDIKTNGYCILQDYANDREALDWLLDQGVDISRTDHIRTDTGGRPGQCHDYSLKVLNNVAAGGDIELFDYLVARGADPHRSLALHCASKCEDVKKATAMIDHLLDVHSMDIEADNEKLRDFFHSAGDSGTPLNCAVFYQNLPAVHKLLERGADPQKALFATICSVITDAWVPALEPLLDAGANADHALAEAVDCLNFGAAKICVAKGADAAKVLEKQQARIARIEAGSPNDERDREPGADADWSEDDEETAGSRREMRDYLKSASLDKQRKAESEEA